MNSLKHIPLSNPEAIYDSSKGAVVSNLVLPVGVDTERILMNVPKVSRLSRWAGSEAVHLVTHEADRSDIDTFDAQIQSDGSALMAGFSRKPKRVFSSWVYDEEENPMSDTIAGISVEEFYGDDEDAIRRRMSIYKAGRMALYLDRRAMQDEVRDNDRLEKGMVDPRGWAGVLDKAVKRGFVDSAIDRYTLGAGRTSLELTGDIALKYLVIEGLVTGNYFFPAVVGIPAYLRRATQLHRVITEQTPPGSFNWSLFNDLRVDRAVATAITAKTGRVFKYRK